MGYTSGRSRFYLVEGLLNRHLRFLLGDLKYQPLLAEVSLEGPCVYLLRYMGRHGLYRTVSAGGPVVYVGSTRTARRRLSDHRRSLEWAADLSPADFLVGLVPTASVEMGRYVEARLIHQLDPPWNRSDWAGFGSKPQGKARQGGQHSSPWDRLHPGRPWAARKRPSPAERSRRSQ